MPEENRRYLEPGDEVTDEVYITQQWDGTKFITTNTRIESRMYMSDDGEWCEVMEDENGKFFIEEL